MSNTIGNNDFYLFLAKQSDWKKEADTNNDDVITKTEFTVYLDNEFDWSNFDLNGKNKAERLYFFDKI